MFGRLMLFSMMSLSLLGFYSIQAHAQSDEGAVVAEQSEDVGDLPARIAIVQELMNILQRERNELELQNGLLENYVAQNEIAVGGIWTGPEGKPSREIKPEMLDEAMQYYVQDIHSIPMSGTRGQLTRILQGLWYLAFKQQGEIERMVERNQKLIGAIKTAGQIDAFEQWISVGMQEKAEREAVLRAEAERKREMRRAERQKQLAEIAERNRVKREARIEYQRERRLKIIEERARTQRLRNLFNPSPTIYVPPGYAYYGTHGFVGPSILYTPHTTYHHLDHSHYYTHKNWVFTGSGIYINW